MGGGQHPSYNTQVSFKNRVDDFFIAFINSKPLLLDVYLSKGQKAVHIGRSTVSLRSLIAGPSVIEEWTDVMPMGSVQTAPLGKIKYVMRLRKGISELMRMFRDVSDVNNMAKAVELK